MPDLGGLLGSLMPGRPAAPRRASDQSTDQSASGSWEQSRGHRSAGRTHDENDD